MTEATKPLISSINMQATLLATMLNDIYTSFLENGKINYNKGRCGEFFGFAKLYDYAVDVEKIDLNIGDEAKKELWLTALQTTNNWNKALKVNASKEVLKRIATRNYKSELIYYYLVRKFNDTGIRMEIVSNGVKIKSWE